MGGAGLDLEWSGHFYVPGGANNGWIIGRAWPWGAIYDYGEIPGVVLAIGACFLYMATIVSHVGSRYRKPCLIVILTALLGPGLIVNVTFKNVWGRPRPVDVGNFGGHENFRNVWEPGGPGYGKSFTCGHCAMAFSIASTGAFFPYHPLAASLGVAAGVIFGTAAGVARVAQGGHFPTDVLWSGVLVLIIIAGLYYLVFRIPEDSTSGSNIRKA